jgi:predicted enzyme related to lactoylglutathione lyase
MAFKNAISWFEIPTIDINRAQKFYETIFETSLIPLDLQNFQMRMFPIEDQMTGIGGALCYNKDFYKPSSTDGPLIYLNGNPDVQKILDKVETAGGKILVPKTQISPEYGHMAVFIDTEGNRIALHSIPQQ